MRALLPSPERIALAYMRNWFADARRAPRSTAVDIGLLAFVGLMLFGFQFQLVSKAIAAYPAKFQLFINYLPLAAVFATISVPSYCNPVAILQAMQGNWFHSLPLANATYASWAIRKAVYAALVVSALFTVPLLDVTWLATPVISVQVSDAALLWILPALTVTLHGILRWRSLTHPQTDTREIIAAKSVSNVFESLAARPRDPITRAVARFHFATAKRTYNGLVWFYLIGSCLAVVGVITVAWWAKQPQLLVVAAFVLPLGLSSVFEADYGHLYRVSRSLPLSFRRVALANILWSAVLPLIVVLPLILATLLGIGGLSWLGVLTITAFAVSMILMFRVLVALAYPQSHVQQTFLGISVTIAVGMLALQASLIGPFIALVLGGAWLWEKGYGTWEYGYGGKRDE